MLILKRFVKQTIAFMSILSLFGCGHGARQAAAAPAVPAPAPSAFPQDRLQARDGSDIVLTFYTHASIALWWNGCQIYIDPTGDAIQWAAEPKASFILVTHSHGDHFNQAVIRQLKEDGAYLQMKPGEKAEPFPGVQVEAVPAYNISEGHLQFHPKDRGDAGYIVTLGGTRIYVAGDTEDNEDVLALKDIDVAFLPVNQPYTMTVPQCVRVVEAIRPGIFYPYHYGGSGQPTDLEALKQAVSGITDIRIRPLE